MTTISDIRTYLKEVTHPAKADKSIVELGMVDKVSVSTNAEGAPKVSVTLAFSRHRDPLAEYLIGSTRAALIRNLPKGADVEVLTVVKY